MSCKQALLCGWACARQPRRLAYPRVLLWLKLLLYLLSLLSIAVYIFGLQKAAAALLPRPRTDLHVSSIFLFVTAHPAWHRATGLGGKCAAHSGAVLQLSHCPREACAKQCSFRCDGL